MALALKAIIAEEVRKLSGYTETKTISDNDLEDIVDLATRFVLEDLYQERYREKVIDNDGTLADINGTNKTFYVKHHPIADIDGDGTVDSNDITGQWVDDNYDYQTAKIVVVDAERGKLTITQDDDSAIPNDAKEILVHYWTRYLLPKESVIDDARKYLTAHLVEIRVAEPDKISIHDLESNRRLLQISPTRFLLLYNKIMRRVCRPKMIKIS
jgi:hypothetical protein